MGISSALHEKMGTQNPDFKVAGCVLLRYKDSGRGISEAIHPLWQELLAKGKDQ